MISADSYISRGSQNTQTIISKLASRTGDQYNQQTLKSLSAVLDEEIIAKAWSSFGLYLGRQIRMGRGILIKSFGTFSFSAPEVVLDVQLIINIYIKKKGVTNPLERDTQLRRPVFLVAKEYVKGKNLRAAVASNGSRQLRPYQLQTSGIIQQTMINYAEIAVYAQQTKDSVKSGVDRVLKAIAEMARKKENVEIEIPGVGNLLIRNDLAGVSFHESLVSQCRGITKRPLSERKQRGQMELTQDKLANLSQSKIQDQFIDEKARVYLNNTLGLNVNAQGGSIIRPTTSKFPSTFILKGKQDRIQTAFNRSQINDKVIDDTYAMERLKYYIRESALNFEDAFIDLCNNAFGRTNERRVRMSLKDLGQAVKKIGLPLSDPQVVVLFKQLDMNSDGWVDKNDFLSSIDHQKSHIEYIKDVVYKYQIHTDDLLQRMNLNREHPPLRLGTLKSCLMNLDVSLTLMQATKIASDILGGQESITIEQLVSIFSTLVEETDKTYDASWFKDTLHRLKARLRGTQFKRLTEAFEYFDGHQEGNLDTANFKTVIMENNVGLSVQDINRLVRYIPKTRGNLINYYDFLGTIEDVDKRANQGESHDLIDFAQKLGMYLKQKQMGIRQFLQNISQSSSTSVSPTMMASYIREYIIKSLLQETTLQFCMQADIDGDGVVSEEDLEAFVSRWGYFGGGANKTQKELSRHKSLVGNKGDALSQIEQTLVNSHSTNQAFNITSFIDGLPASQNQTLHPQEALTEDKFDRILKDIRIKLTYKGLTYQDFFKLLDSDNKGFITPSDFSNNVDKVINLSQPAKDGFFGYMDYSGSGLVDMTSFIRAISKSTVQKAAKLTEDSYEWELDILMRIRNWWKREGISVEDAFRIVDRDFDGEISKEDIRMFLFDVLKIPQLTKAQVNRLFKLLDQFKRGRVTLIDFRRFLEEGMFYGQNTHVFGDPQSRGQETLSAKKYQSTHSSFDWKANARQQIALVISRHFASIKGSFDIISDYRKKMLFAQFKKWIDQQNTLAGFDLTEHMLYQLFADIDVHKKGALNEVDWINAFGHFDCTDQMIAEISDSLKSNFPQGGAQTFFLRGQSVVTWGSFKASLETLFPTRFSDPDIRMLWKKVSMNNQMTAEAFRLVFEEKREIFNVEATEDDHKTRFPILEKLRRYLRNSNIDFSQQCKQFDIQNTGFITNLQLRQVIRSLGMGLTGQEIDQICSLCQLDQSSNLDWKNFAGLLTLKQVDNHIIERAGIHLHKLNEHCYNHLISPKDAFRQCDVAKRGVLTFEQFKQLCEKLYSLANEDAPPFTIIKDIYDFIDKRQDDMIDLTEWMDAFSRFPNPKAKSISKRPSTSHLANRGQKSYEKRNLSQGKSMFSLQANRTSPFDGITDDGLLNANSKFKSFLRRPQSTKQILKFEEKDNGVWESSKHFDTIIQAIGKNRRYLNEIFKYLSQNQREPLSEQMIVKEFDKMLRSQGVIVNEQQWASLMAWATRNNTIDYKFLLSVYKDRVGLMDQQPRMNTELLQTL